MFFKMFNQFFFGTGLLYLLVIMMNQGSNYLFRSDPQRFREKLEGMGERCKPAIGDLGPKCCPNARK